MFKHIHAAHMANYCNENGISLSEYSKVLNPNRIDTEELDHAISGDSATDQNIIDALIQKCAICDSHGVLITGQVKRTKRSTPRQSVVEFGWIVGIPEHNGTKNYIHLKLVNDSGTSGGNEESNEGQNIFHRPANYGKYAFICNIETYRIGLNDITRTYSIDDSERDKRYKAILMSLISSILNPEGAMTSTQKPHITDFKGVVSWSHKLIPAPTVSALNGDYAGQLETIVGNLNDIIAKINMKPAQDVASDTNSTGTKDLGKAIEYEKFNDIATFVSIIGNLMNDTPYKIK